MSLIKFTETKLSNTDKKGLLKPDESGYYEHVIGGLNTFNSAGEYYVANGAKELFEQSSSFMRRIKNGCLKGEMGHPTKNKNMSMDDFMQRVLTIDEKNVCVHYSDIYLDINYGKNNPQFKNPNLIAIIAKLKPTGPYGNALNTALENEKENVCFSIRALTKDTVVNGVRQRTLVQIVTWDCVTEPGISISNKWDSPALESISEIPLTLGMLEKINDSYPEAISIESKELLSDTVKLVTMALKPHPAPAFSKW